MIVIRHDGTPLDLDVTEPIAGRRVRSLILEERDVCSLLEALKRNPARLEAALVSLRERFA